jgi:hypothetical protein
VKWWRRIHHHATLSFVSVNCDAGVCWKKECNNKEWTNKNEPNDEDHFQRESQEWPNNNCSTWASRYDPPEWLINATINSSTDIFEFRLRSLSATCDAGVCWRFVF